MRRPGTCACAVLVLSLILSLGRSPAWAQSAQAALLGRVTDPAGKALARALVIQRNLQTNLQTLRYTNEHGFYSLLGIPPGSYSVQAHALGYQPEERSPVELTVSARLELNFVLQPKTAAAPAAGGGAQPAGRAHDLLSRLYGADAAVPQAVLLELELPATETLVASLSYLVDERKILELAPIVELGGNDVFNLLLLQPGVTSDSATARGLGSTVNGQRFTSSNFLLDGVDNNDLLASGPATRISSDAVKEFRVLRNNFPAEFGRASGFIVQAITRAGTNTLHGSLFEYFKHHRLNANSFSNNWQGVPRSPFRQDQYGGSLGGPLRRDRLFFFGNIERLPSSSQGPPLHVFLPSRALVSALPQDSIARRLLTAFPPPEGEAIPGVGYATRKKVAQPFLERNTMGLGRLDFSPSNGKHRLGVRYAASQRNVENAVFSLYPGLSGPLEVGGRNLMANYTRELALGSNELRFGYNRASVSVLRPHPEVPILASLDGVSLPGGQAAYDYSFRDRSFHAADSLNVLKGTHALAIGFEWRQLLHDSLLSPVRDGYYLFDSLLNFAFDEPTFMLVSLDPETGQPSSDRDYQRAYQQREFAAFIQDNVKATRRLALNLGLRYEYFGVPASRNGTRERNFVFGDGRDIGERIAHGRFGSGPLYRPDRNNLAARVGFALDLTGNARTVLRGAYGLFFDRIFNNFWLDTRLNNSAIQLLVNFPGEPPQFRYTLPARLGVTPIGPADIQPQPAVLVDSGLRTPYAQSWFVGLQRQLSPNTVLEVNHAGSLGRKLLTADTINRLFSLPASVQSSSGRFNRKEADISYRANQGHSDFADLEVSLVRRWSKGLQFQVSYTYSRTRDVQSDPLLRRASSAQQSSANLLNPTFFQVASAFARQFDSAADYGLSDFDQAQSLVFNFVAQSPEFRGWKRVLGGWQASALAGLRSGFPFSVYSPDVIPQSGGVFILNRADVLGGHGGDAFLPRAVAMPGGVVLLNSSKFRAPAEGELGNTPRNAFRGPGLWNADVALGRSFAVPFFRERAHLQVRAEFFNVFNHANLNNPNPFLGSSAFGEALFGRQGFRSALPVVLPVDEQPRRIQLAAKLTF